MNTTKQQLKLLRSIAPDASRKANLRRVLESKVALESSALPARSTFAFMMQSVRASHALALAVIITLVASGSGASFAAQSAVPGETLYKVKLATEQARVTITPGKKAKAELHLGFASRRLHEIEQLIEKDSGAHSAVNEALARYENELNESEAIIMKNPALAQTISSIIGETTESHKQTLKRVAEKAHARSFNGDLDDDFDDAYEHAESKDDAILYAVLAATSTPPVAISPVIKEKSRKKWESIEHDIKKIETVRIDPSAPELAAPIATGTAAALSTAQERVHEAKERWENGEYSEALKHSIEARELVKKAEKMEKESKKEREREKTKREEERRDEDKDEYENKD